MPWPACRAPCSTSCAAATGPAARSGPPPGAPTPPPTRWPWRSAGRRRRRSWPPASGSPRSELDALQVDVHRAIMVSIDADTGGDGALAGPAGHRRLPRARRCCAASGPGTSHDAIRALPDRLDEVDRAQFLRRRIADRHRRGSRGDAIPGLPDARPGADPAARRDERGVGGRSRSRPTAACAPATSSAPTSTGSPPAAPAPPPAADPPGRAAPLPPVARRPRSSGRPGWQTPDRCPAPRERTARPA